MSINLESLKCCGYNAANLNETQGYMGWCTFTFHIQEFLALCEKNPNCFIIKNL